MLCIPSFTFVVTPLVLVCPFCSYISVRDSVHKDADFKCLTLVVHDVGKSRGMVWTHAVFFFAFVPLNLYLRSFSFIN